MKDFELNSENDLMIVNGDFHIGSSANNDIQLLIVSTPGDWRQYPKCGADATSEINSSDAYAFKLRIEEQLRADGFEVNYVKLNNGEIDIDATK
jgi:hypothetical protein